MAQPVTQQDTQPPAETLAIYRIKAMATTLRNSVVTFGGVTQESLHTRAADALDDYHAALTRRAGGDAIPAGWSIDDGKPISEAPCACHVLAGRLDHDAGEWIMAVVSSPPIYPFTHWWPLPGMIATPKPPAGGDAGAVGPLRQALQQIHDAPDNLVPAVTVQRMRNIAGFALLGEQL